MKNKKANHKNLSITVGIPAYNEEQNISYLIKSILNQKCITVTLDKILIVSDGSTDKTVSSANSFSDKRIEVIVNEIRQGQNTSQNIICTKAKSDVLVLLNCDVLLGDRHFLENIVKPFKKRQKAGVVGAKTMSVKPRTFFEKIFADSHVYKTEIYKRLNGGNNIYMSYGVGQAFSKELYKCIRWPKNCPEDSYAYLYAVKRGFTFVYESSAIILFRSPSTYQDHLKQTKRFRGGQKVLKGMFGDKFVHKEFAIPFSILLKVFFITFPKIFITLSSYFIVQVYTEIISMRAKNYFDKHDISTTTKQIVVSIILILLIVGLKT